MTYLEKLFTYPLIPLAWLSDRVFPNDYAKIEGTAWPSLVRLLLFPLWAVGASLYFSWVMSLIALPIGAFLALLGVDFTGEIHWYDY